VLAAAARAAKKPCVAVSGRRSLAQAACRKAGFSAVMEAPALRPAEAKQALRRLGPGLARQLEAALPAL
jgi:hypothetical protein